MALPLFAVTLFVSAFILFLVQPIVGKIILPKLGGTPQVWNTCMVFFQMVLLAGYAYTHNVSTRFNLRQQLMAHGVLLLLPLIVLLPFPFALGGYFGTEGEINPHSLWGFVPDLGSNPIPSTLKILFMYVALPFLVVATSAPLLQKWFVHTGHPASKDPYFLYGASNLGSMLSLIVYPVLIEPYVSLKDQGWVYTVGYLALGVFVLACAVMVWNSKDAMFSPRLMSEPKPAPSPSAAQTIPEPADTGIAAGAPAPPAPAAAVPPVTPAAAATSVKPGQPPAKPHRGAGQQRPHGAEAPVHVPSDDMTFGRRFRWVMLAAVPSSLMLGITTHITTDLSPIPLFWLIPLILYLLSFILVFARWPVVWIEQPHTYFLYAQPFCVALMIMVDVLSLTGDTRFLAFAIFAHVLGFFTTTMVCHGEMSKDRPSTKHLTEFYLWMSVGGMVGGMFNALIAPLVFPKLWELPLAIFAAVLVRPKMFEVGALDNWIAGLFEGKAETPAAKPGHKGAKPVVHAAPSGVVANESLVRTLDFAWPVAVLIVTVLLLLVLSTTALTNEDAGRARRNMMIDFALPLLAACVCLARPVRIGLSIGAVLLVFHIHQAQGDTSTEYSSRSYFGAISVKKSRNVRGGSDFYFRQLIHGHIDHGMNFLVPDLKDRGNPDKDFSRLATTYYHRDGPVGRVMEKYNWSPDKPNANTYHADARLPASLLAGVFGDACSNSLPLTSFVTLWSEPPIATVGLGTGTMASYGRPYQHVHFYEIDNQILRLSIAGPRGTHDIKAPEDLNSRETPFQVYEKIKDASRYPTWFNYLERAVERGCTVQVLMGDARLRMALPYKNHYRKEGDRGGGPEKFYHMMVVDAFSSDAIPAHLLTKEAFEMYFDRLTEEGILCVHTSNRFVDLPKVVSAVATDLEFAHLRGHDANRDSPNGHYNSEWVMVARKNEYLKHLSGDTDFLAKYKVDFEANSENKGREFERYWDPVAVNAKYVWRDDYYNLLSVVRWR